MSGNIDQGYKVCSVPVANTDVKKTDASESNKLLGCRDLSILFSQGEKIAGFFSQLSNSKPHSAFRLKKISQDDAVA